MLYSLTFIVTSMRRCEASQCTNIPLAADALKPTISPHCDIAQYSTVSISRDAASSDKLGLRRLKTMEFIVTAYSMGDAWRLRCEFRATVLRKLRNSKR